MYGTPTSWARRKKAAIGDSCHTGRPGQDVKRQPWATSCRGERPQHDAKKGLPLRQVEQSVAGDSHEEQLVAGDSHEEGWRQESASG